MSGEARSMWERFITAPQNATLLKRYAKSAKEPAPLFNSIGEDLGSSNEKVRETAFWGLVVATPELTNILHERETRSPGWRDGRGKDQKMVNLGADIVSDLHRKLVKEHRFKTHDGYGKDPRPYVKRAIRNRERDEERKRKNRDGIPKEVPLDYEAALEIPDPAGSLEDIVLENRGLEELEKELLAWGFREEELDLCRTVYVDESPFDEIRERFGIRSQPALRQQISRARKSMVAVRDALFTDLLITGNEFAKRGKLPRFSQDPERSEEWARRAKASIQARAWVYGTAADGKNEVAIRALTRGLRRARAHIYLIAVLKGFEKHYGYTSYTNNKPVIAFTFYPGYGAQCPNNTCNFIDLLRRYLIDEINHETIISILFRRLDAYPTELPGLNEALADVGDDYIVFLVSNSFQVELDILSPLSLSL